MLRPGISASPATSPTAAILATALSVSKMTLGPKTLRAPESGLIRLKSSFSAWGWGRKPTWAAPASSPAPRQSAAIGPTPRAIVETAVSIRPFNPAALVACVGFAISARIWRKAASPELAMCGPSKLTPARPAASTSEPPTSAERATCPSLRARSRCLGVAFSVRSSWGMLRSPAPAAHRAGHHATCRAPSAAPTLVDI